MATFRRTDSQPLISLGYTTLGTLIVIVAILTGSYSQPSVRRMPPPGSARPSDGSVASVRQKSRLAGSPGLSDAPPKGLVSTEKRPIGEVEYVRTYLAPAWSVKPDQVEVRLWDGSRADMLTEAIAWEVDWADKWKEAPAQATLYAELTGRQPGVVLLTTDPIRDRHHLLRAQVVCTRHRIRLAIVTLPDPLPPPY